jgi:hypothetical protein
MLPFAKTGSQKFLEVHSKNFLALLNNRSGQNDELTCGGLKVVIA